MQADAINVSVERKRWAYRMLIGSIGLSTSLTINDVHITTRGTLLFPDDRSMHLLCGLLRGDHALYQQMPCTTGR